MLQVVALLTPAAILCPVQFFYGVVTPIPVWFSSLVAIPPRVYALNVGALWFPVFRS